MRRVILFSVITIGVIFFAAGCGANKDAGGANAPTGLIVVNAPVAGEVRRVLVSENIAVAEGAPIVEIAVRPAATNQANRDGARPNAPNRRSAVDEAQREVERTSVEISRVEQLVASKAAPQSQLDAARADFQKAQERLEQLQKRAATDSLPAQPVGDRASAEPTDEKIVQVRVPSAGGVRVISVKRGQTVTAGQPLATVSVDDR
ncbi:MAG TPA: hypothetical protein VIL74_15860 [Pyrinomonadaceae bacterium]|jgi:multidrug resistance efflux pump